MTAGKDAEERARVRQRGKRQREAEIRREENGTQKNTTTTTNTEKNLWPRSGIQLAQRLRLPCVGTNSSASFVHAWVVGRGGLGCGGVLSGDGKRP